MTVKNGHDFLGYALGLVADALLSRETNLSSALVSSSARSMAIAIIDGSTAFKHQCKAATGRAKNNEPKRGHLDPP
ncbi:BQ5605_C005g03602 [Microbotryum silenes-dioicae]|uniref:BQ5605_C005g03602 protein n=1 Tax=Microbotryum silenes-dioicae TaxID=796604 RepID=A0A2X0MBE0_9BASI|nr:BQ5605_C005g03602 [Microbotryum silenes-dioicae]